MRKRVRKDGTATFQVMWRDRDSGKQEGITFANEGDAVALKRLLDANGNAFSVAQPMLQSASGVTVAEVVREHIDLMIKPTPHTIATYRTMLELHIRESLGAMPVASLDYRHLTAWVKGMQAKGLAPKTIRNVFVLISSAMETAVRLKYRPDNPCKGVDLPSVERADDSTMFLTYKEFAQLRECMDPRYRSLVSFLVITGARWSEATAVTVGDVNLGTSPAVVRISKAWKRNPGHGWYIGPPKTATSKRTVSLPHGLAEMLRPLVEGRAPAALLFTNGAGSRITQSDFWARYWQPALRAVNATHPTYTKAPKVHHLRHTSASWLIQEGVPLFTIARRLGHSDTSLLDRVYGHLMPDAQQETATAIGRAMMGEEVAEAPPVELPEIEA